MKLVCPFGVYAFLSAVLEPRVYLCGLPFPEHVVPQSLASVTSHHPPKAATENTPELGTTSQ